PVELGEAERTILTADPAVEGRIGNIMEPARRLGAKFDRPAAVDAGRRFLERDGRVGVEQRTFRVDLRAETCRARIGQGLYPDITPFAQAIIVRLVDPGMPDLR